ncbi:HAD family hydrolase [Coraliomargarita parva]|uniref:HAD family hydrolase n=1 Tax=Coraliomargarita parva TaxID=3014050 RepID=UPI0022B4E53F|nr:HAD family hydrolase [Coraliomargarita parva]
MTKKLVLFDMDGVLLDSKANMEVAWETVQQATGVTVPFADYFRNIGRPFGDILKIIGVEGDYKEIERIYRVASLEAMNRARLFPGVNRMLQALHSQGCKLGLVTSKDGTRTQVVLSRLQVDFITVQTPDKRYRGKPAPDYLLLAMAESQEDPADTIYIGDMDTDYEAAQRAGIDYLHADWGYCVNPEGNTRVAHQVSEIPDKINDIAKARN